MYFIKMMAGNGTIEHAIIYPVNEAGARADFGIIPLSGRFVRLELWRFSELLDVRDA